MEELKLYMVYYLGEAPCWNLRVARSEEEAITQCFNKSKKPKPPGAHESSCRVEEVRIKGYKINIEKQ